MITKYYAYYAGRFCKDLAKKADLIFTAIGVRAWGKEILGIEDEPKEKTYQLPPLGNQELLEYVREVKTVSTDFAEIQPRLAQELTDVLMNRISQEKRVLEGSKLRGVVEIALDMGYKQASNSSTRTKLGRFVKNQVGHLAQPEERLCNGTTQTINCYPDCSEVRESIITYFERQF